MKKLFIFILTGFILACNQDDKTGKGNTLTEIVQETSDVDSANLTTIEWIDSTHQDLGKVTKGQVVEVSYRFKNTGDKPLIIEHARAGCGCTVPNPPKEPIPPGAEQVIKATFDSKNQQAVIHTKPITVVANTKPSATHNLTFTVEVVE